MSKHILRAIRMSNHLVKLGLREANQKFSKVVRAVRAGHDVVLTDRGNAIGVAKPVNDLPVEG